jgi:hypothetical protein
MTRTPTGLRAAADRLIAAAAGPLQCDPVRDLLDEADITSAYAVVAVEEGVFRVDASLRSPLARCRTGQCASTGKH